MLGSAKDDVDEERKGAGDRRDRSNNKGKEERASKPKPSGFRTGPTSHAKTPKKKLAWAETPGMSYSFNLSFFLLPLLFSFLPLSPLSTSY